MGVKKSGHVIVIPAAFQANYIADLNVSRVTDVNHITQAAHHYY